jgi:replicative superfamily II helicase
MNEIVLSRKELYDLVWSAPMSSILKKYEISPSELRKILKEMRITLSEMGYWQKIQYGKPFEIKELSNDY